MAGPEDEIAAGAGGDGSLRASHADRERVIDTLKAAFVQGMLAKDELDERVDQAFGSRTYADLAGLTADLPVRLAAAQAPGQTVPAQPQLPVNKALLWGSWAAVLLIVGFMAGASLANYQVALLGVLPLLITAPIAGTLTLDTWREKRSSGQLPQGPAPGAGGQVSRRLPPAGSGEQLPRADHSNRYVAEAARSRRPHRRRVRAEAALTAS